jgi:Tfp pilus assembly protein PilO
VTPALDRYALFAAVLVLLGGYLFVFRPAESAIAARYAQLDDGRRALERRSARERRIADLRAEERALRARLASSGVGDDASTIVARVLHAVATTASAENCTVTGVAAVAGLPNTAASFDTIPLTVSLRGTYARLIAFVRTLGRSDDAIHIALDDIGAADPRAHGAPVLRATLRITLLRLAHPIAGEPHASI